VDAAAAAAAGMVCGSGTHIHGRRQDSGAQ